MTTPYCNSAQVTLILRNPLNFYDFVPSYQLLITQVNLHPFFLPCAKLQLFLSSLVFFSGCNSTQDTLCSPDNIRSLPHANESLLCVNCTHFSYCKSAQASILIFSCFSSNYRCYSYYFWQLLLTQVINCLSPPLPLQSCTGCNSKQIFIAILGRKRLLFSQDKVANPHRVYLISKK